MKDKYTVTTLRMSLELHSRLKLFCVEEKVSMKKFIERAIERELEKSKSDLIPNLHKGKTKKAIL